MEVIKVREVGIAIEVKRSDAGDVSPVVMFYKGSQPECDIRENLDTNEYPNIFE